MSIAENFNASLAASEEQTTAEGVENASGYLVRLPGTSWNLWRTVAVRGTGFPAAMVNDLAAAEAATAADQYLACRARSSRHESAALRRLSGELRGSRDSRRQLRVVRSAILAGKAEEVGDNPEAVAAAEARARMESARQAFVASYEAAVETINRRLIGFSQEPRFREAMLWQSADSTRRIWHDLRPEARGTGRRSALKQIAMRVQRYCVKNDSIGFFGPVGWGTIQDDGERFSLGLEAGLLARREVFFESWSIDTLVACLDKEEVRPWVAPRMKSGVWIQGSRVYRPQRKEISLSEEEMAVLAECDGMRTAKQVAEAVLEHSALPEGSRKKEVFAILERLVAAGVIAWRLEVAPQLHPERELEERISRIGDAELRVSCMAALDELVGARDRVAMAAGNPGELDHALQGLEECFTRLTAQSPSRRGGQVYAARTLVYEDCRRDCEVRFGTGLLKELAQPLGIVLDAARWVLAEVGRTMNEQLCICLAEMAQLKEQRHSAIDCHSFLEYVTSKLYVDKGQAPVFAPIRQRFQLMWQRVLGQPSQSSSTRVVFPLDQVLARAAEIFPPCEIGWCLGRYVCPDLMIAASSVDAICRGEYTAILGEVHSENTIASSVFASLHPNPHWLSQAITEDTRYEKFVTRQRPSAVWLARTNDVLIQPQHWRYQFGDDLPCHPVCQGLPAGMLIVTGTESSVMVQARDGSVQFNAIELFGGPIGDEADRLISEFLPRLPHIPRMSLGNFVISREHWNVMPQDMPFLRETDPPQQFLEIRSWGHSLGIPRRVFVKSPAERKPWFLDLDSPVFTSIFASLMRKLPADAQVRLVEMFPDLSDLWLVDRDGRHYTGELRMVGRAVPLENSD